jgi:hypothetical protein
VPEIALLKNIMHSNLIIGLLVIDIFTRLTDDGNLFTEDFTRFVKVGLRKKKKKKG